jgi:hypothetical protein
MASNSSTLLVPTQPGGTNLLDIRPLKAPVEIPSTYGWVWWVLAAVIAAFAAWFIWRKLTVKKPFAKPVVLIPPYRKAKDRLRTAGQLMSDPYKFCSLVSDVLRAYVEERFDLHAPERTTEEFMEELRASTKLTPEHKALLEDFLSRCDLVKFARFEPTHPELQSLLDSALRFVDETAPLGESSAAPEEEKAAAA